MKADKESFAFSECGSTEVAGGAEQGGEECGLVGFVFFQIELRVILAFDGDDDIDGFGECQRFFFRFLFFARVGGGDDFDLVLAQELLSMFAGFSVFAVIEPVDGDGHGDSRLSESEPQLQWVPKRGLETRGRYQPIALARGVSRLHSAPCLRCGLPITVL